MMTSRKFVRGSVRISIAHFGNVMLLWYQAALLWRVVGQVRPESQEITAVL